MAKNFCLIVARICAFPSTQLHTNSLKFESEISLKNGVQNGARHFEGAARRRPKAAVAERQQDFRKEVEAAETPAGAEGAGRVPLKGAVSAADWG